MLGANLWVERNGVAYHKAFGQRAIKPEAEVMTEDTLFDVASVTKAVAAASAAIRCVERDLIQLDDLVSKPTDDFFFVLSLEIERPRDGTFLFFLADAYSLARLLPSERE